MTAEQFTYWLQGFIELNGGKMPTAEQWKSVQEHLSTVFVKVTPPLNAPKETPRKTKGRLPIAPVGEPPDEKTVCKRPQVELDEAARKLNKKKLDEEIRRLQEPFRHVEVSCDTWHRRIC